MLFEHTVELVLDIHVSNSKINYIRSAISSSTVSEVGRKSVEDDSCEHTGLPHYFVHSVYDIRAGLSLSLS